jgi:hypothetical protein
MSENEIFTWNLLEISQLYLERFINQLLKIFGV